MSGTQRETGVAQRKAAGERAVAQERRRRYTVDEASGRHARSPSSARWKSRARAGSIARDGLVSHRTPPSTTLPHRVSIRPPIAPPWPATCTAPDAFIAYPTNRVVGTIVDPKLAQAAIEALLQVGFARQDIDILHGEEDLHRPDPTGAEHRFLAQFQRTLIRTLGDEHKHLQHLRRGRAGGPMRDHGAREETRQA